MTARLQLIATELDNVLWKNILERSCICSSQSSPVTGRKRENSNDDSTWD